MRKITKTYSFLKGDGLSRRELLRVLKARGIAARPAYSIYVGHTAIEVDGGQRIQDRAARIIFGR
jgi:hypothetical protein